jgi:pyruvate/2-oxoglutarate/acetoin dehydrogenase E1 component
VGGENVYHWLLSKDIVSDDEIREGIITQKDFEDMEKEALKAQEVLKEKGINIRVIDVHTIKPLDKEMIIKDA